MAWSQEDLALPPVASEKADIRASERRSSSRAGRLLGDRPPDYGNFIDRG
jgi:hypothetical protein